MVYHKGLDIGLGRAFEGKSARLIATDGNNLSREIPFTAGFDQSLEVGAAAGRQHQDFGQRSLVCLHAERSPGA